MKDENYPDKRYCKAIKCETYNYIEKIILHKNIGVLHRDIFVESIKEERKKCNVCKAKTYKDFLEGKLGV